MKSIKNIALVLLMSAYSGNLLVAQIHNPEAQKMRENAQKDISRGNYSNAILLYNQAIKLEPNDLGLRKDLAYAHYLNGTLETGKEIISEVLKTDYADEQTYQIAAAIESKTGQSKKAKSILNDGLKKYPNSALLYNNRGNLMALDGKSKQAIQNFESGIIANPNYAANYFSLAKEYEAEQPLWSLLYYEVFINLEPNTAKTAEAKSNFFKAYINYFKQNNSNELPSFGSKSGAEGELGFGSVLASLIDKNVAAMTTGVNVESLAMLRTRIILDWDLKYAAKYPYPLLTYHEKLIKSGNFQSYNQWLFGANENSTVFSTWIKNNTEAYSGFEKWMQRNPLQMNSSDFKPFH